jgi:hypothetical protein
MKERHFNLISFLLLSFFYCTSAAVICMYTRDERNVAVIQLI